MPIKGTPAIFRVAPSIDQRWNNEQGAANRIQNFRVDPQGHGWLADRGIEPWRSFGDASIMPTQVSPYLDTKVDSQFIWTKQSTGQVYYFIEQGGELYYLWGNKGAGGASQFWQDKVTIATGRRLRKVGDPGTQYIPYGNRLLILNGYDKPIWFYGNSRSRDFGFTIATPAVESFGVTTGYVASGGTIDETGLRAGLPRPSFKRGAAKGLGDTGDGDINTFSHKMTYVTDTGSESPLGSATRVSWEMEGGSGRQSIYINEVPTGPKGTVARRIYRTKNMRGANVSGGQDELYYLVKEIKDNSTTEYIDIVSDRSLITAAPSLTDSAVISNSYQFGAAWNNRIWLAGGSLHPTSIIYSKAGLPEQFPTFNYIDVGATAGGHITAIMGYYNSLVVFRERSIDIIRFSNGTYVHAQLTPEVGTTASNTIALVPGVGLVFLTIEGLYAVSGGLDGGSQVSVTKISGNIGNEMNAVSPVGLPSCIAAYSKKEDEYWLHYVRKGESVPTRGIVLHSDKMGYSMRSAVDKSNEYLWSFTTMQVDPDGNFILGTRPDWRASNGSPGNPSTVGHVGKLVGLQVWSGSNSWGHAVSVSSTSGGDQGAITYAVANEPLQSNLWESNWMDFGAANIKHRVFHVEMEMISYGDNPVELEWGYDYDITWHTAGEQKISKSEVVFTSKEDPVFGPADATVTKRTFVIGQDALLSARKVVIRWDVNTGLVQNFRFRVKQSEGKPFHIIGFNINYGSRDQKALNQRAGRN